MNLENIKEYITYGNQKKLSKRSLAESIFATGFVIILDLIVGFVYGGIFKHIITIFASSWLVSMVAMLIRIKRDCLMNRLVSSCVFFFYTLFGIYLLYYGIYINKYGFDAMLIVTTTVPVLLSIILLFKTHIRLKNENYHVSKKNIESVEKYAVSGSVIGIIIAGKLGSILADSILEKICISVFAVLLAVLTPNFFLTLQKTCYCYKLKKAGNI